MLTAATNLLRLARADHHLRPRIAIYYPTEQCNFNCSYCEDFGARRNPQNRAALPFDQALSILRLIRSGVDTLMLSGGEALTHPEIDRIVFSIKHELKFRELTLITNGALLDQHLDALALVDRLVISLDSLDTQVVAGLAGISPASARAVIANILALAASRRRTGQTTILNAVLTPETLPGAQSLIDFCRENHLLVSFSPQSVNNWPRYELLVSPEYRALIEKLLRLKQNGAPILGSAAYLRKLLDFEPYDCYPTLAPRIYTNGDLSYPCRPLEKAGNGQGGRVVNLLNFQTWDAAWERARQTYGQPPRTCHSCFQQCYAEPSLMQADPLSHLYEILRYPASRAGHPDSYTPG